MLWLAFIISIISLAIALVTLKINIGNVKKGHEHE